MSLVQRGAKIDYRSTRVDPRGAPAEFEASWIIGASLPQTEPESLEFFLTERYCLYAVQGEKLYRSRIFHQPWPLQTAALSAHQSTMIEALGIAQPESAPLLHYAESLAVGIWPLREVSFASLEC